jgi:NAD(P)H-hydrate epimerase
VWAQTGREAASFDAVAIQKVGVPQPVLMENAGRSAAQVLVRLFDARRVVGLVGPGNNGGDALVVLRTLSSWGLDVTAVLVAPRTRDDALLHGWPIRVVDDADLDEAAWARLWAETDVIVDGILGTGVSGAPRERQAAAMGRVNASGVPVLALDVPSGVDASSGAVPGVGVRAAATVSFGAPKLGALVHPGRSLVGRHVTVEMGFPPMSASDATGRVVTPLWARAHFPRRSTDTHKNRVGRVLVVGGGVGMAGAVVLAARSAFRSGAGLVRVCTEEQNREIVQSALPEAIYVGPEDRAVEVAVEQSDAVAVGPGLGSSEWARVLLRRATGHGTVPLVLDADALNLAAEGVIDLGALAAARAVLITPHPGEMTRLLSAGQAAHDPVSFDRLGQLAEAVRRFECAVLYKGAPSLVGAPSGPTFVDTQSSSDLAVAGMGDTLAGVCASLAAQGSDLHAAGALGLYLSGRAAALAGRGPGLTPSDVTAHLPDALAETTDPVTDLELPFVIFDADAAR